MSDDFISRRFGCALSPLVAAPLSVAAVILEIWVVSASRAKRRVMLISLISVNVKKKVQKM